MHAVGFEGDEHYFAMQFIDGPSLAALIRALRHRNAEGASDDESDAPPETSTLHLRVISDLVSNSSPPCGGGAAEGGGGGFVRAADAPRLA